jgi:hypothetical protein
LIRLDTETALALSIMRLSWGEPFSHWEAAVSPIAPLPTTLNPLRSGSERSRTQGS